MKYVLMLNDMRSSNIENIRAVRVGLREDLIAWHDSLRVEPYRDGQWGKAFKQGSELEWYNPGSFREDNNYFGGVYGPYPDDAPTERLMEFYLCKR